MALFSRLFLAIHLLLLVLTGPESQADEPLSIAVAHTHVPLSGKVGQICVAAEGKFIAAKIQGKSFCAVIDTETRKLVKQVELPSAESIMAATRDKLYAVDGKQKVVRQWSLTTFEMGATVPLPSANVIAAAAGAFSGGPLGLYAEASLREGQLFFLDTKLKPINLSERKSTPPRLKQFAAGPKNLFCSGDGHTFYSTRVEVSPAGIFAVKVNDKEAEFFDAHVSPGFLATDYAAKRICAFGGDFSSNLVRTEKQDPKRALTLPSYDGEWRLGWKIKQASVSLFPPHSTEPLCELTGLPTIEPGTSAEYMNKLLFLISRQSIVFAAETGVDIYRFDLLNQKNNLPSPHLFTLACPNTGTTAGGLYELPLPITSSHKHEVAIQVGPTGMIYDAATQMLRWQVPSDSKSYKQSVILAIGNTAGSSAFLTFQIDVNAPQSVEPALNGNVASLTLDLPKKLVSPAARVDIKLPGTIADFTHVGSGRYIAVHLAALESVGLVDLASRSLWKVIPVTPGPKRLAGTADKLFVYSTTDKNLTRYDLKTAQKEETVSISGSTAEMSIAAGAYGQGPLAVTIPSESMALRPNQYELRLLDPTTFEPLVDMLPSGPIVVASPTGRVFATQGSIRTYVHDTQALSNRSFSRSLELGDFPIPNFNGSMAYSFGSLAFAAELQDNEKLPPATPQTYLVPSLSGNFVVRLALPQADLQTAQVYCAHNMQSIVEFSDLPALPDPSIRTDANNPFFYKPRVALVPEYGAFTIIPISNDVIHVREFNLATQLTEGDADYLFADIVPPAAIARGETLSFPLRIFSKRGDARIMLVTSPEGMTVKDGAIVWSVPKSFAEKSVLVEFELSDASGHAVQNRFKLRIDDIPSRTVSLSTAKPKALDNDKTNAIENVDGKTPKVDLDFRTWTDKQGRKVEAAMLRLVDRETLELQRRDGRKFLVPLANFSDSDIQYVKIRASK